MYYVYILKCKGDKLYTGCTTDVERRYMEHVSGKGGRFTRVYPPTGILYTAPFETRSEACREEYRIKQLSRKEKDELILQGKTKD